MEIKAYKGNCPPIEKIDSSLPPAARSAARKTDGLKRIIEKFKFKGVIAGIRRDEQGTRAKERVFSPRDESGKWDIKNQPPEFWDQSNFNYPEKVHIRIHPLLSWTEVDIWKYIRSQKIPIVDLYFSKNGKRYRSLGDKDITNPVLVMLKILMKLLMNWRQLKHLKEQEESWIMNKRMYLKN